MPGKYARLAFTQELRLREALDTGTHDLEDYTLEVGRDFIEVHTKEQA